MTTLNYLRLTCPICGRRIAGMYVSDSLRVVKHLAPRDTTGQQRWCAASERFVVRDMDGSWKCLS